MAIENTIPMRLRQVYLTMHRTAQAHFASFGVTVDQYVLLSVLADEDGMIQSEISKRMFSDGNTVGAMLRLLEHKELIRRERCETDGRARRVYLTAKGRRLHQKLLRSAQQIHESLDDVLSLKERKAMFSMFDRLTAALAQDSEGA